MNRQQHWSRIYRERAAQEVSWYQQNPRMSLQLIEASGVDTAAPLIDVGAGASTLADHLLDLGYSDITLLDIADEALEQTRKRLGSRAGSITWLCGDILDFQSEREYRLWHDRAVFHFLTDPDEQQRYIQRMRVALQPGAHVIIASFAPDGPNRCSGLETMQYDDATLAGVLGEGFSLQRVESELHDTPSGAQQLFNYCCFRYL